MRQVTTNIYSFDELNKEAQETALESVRESVNEDFMPEAEIIKDEFKVQLEQKSLPSDDVEIDLSYRQGDGVAFYGEIDYGHMMNVNVDQFFNNGHLNNAEYNLYYEIVNNNLAVMGYIYHGSRSNLYSHENTMHFEIDGDALDTIVEDLSVDDGIDPDSDDENDIDQMNEIQDEVEGLFDKLEGLIRDKIVRVSKELKQTGYNMIDEFLSDERIKELITANDFEFYEDGTLV